MEKLQDILEIHGPRDNRVILRQLPDNDDDYQVLLKLVASSKENRLVIDCSPDKAMKILSHAFGVKMMQEYQVQ